MEEEEKKEMEAAETQEESSGEEVPRLDLQQVQATEVLGTTAVDELYDTF